MTDARVSAPNLAAFCAGVLLGLGVPQRDAELTADSLVQADLWGHQSHGVLRLPWYAARLRSGAMSAVSAPETVVDVGAVAVIDGHGGIGQVIAVAAADEAVARAKKHGIGAIGVRDSNHFGAAAYFTRRIARQGCVGLVTTNASPAMAPWGGRVKTVGTNPWSIAAPGGREGQVVLDIANTAVARGKVYLARQRGETLPDGWAIDDTGLPTTDPADALAGLILPMAGHKGYAISFMMDVLSGVLTGSRSGTGVQGPYQPDSPGGVGHLVIALDIEAFGPVNDFNDRLSILVDEVKNVPTSPGFDEVFYPGEIEDLSAARLAESGISLPGQTFADLEKLAVDVGIPALVAA